MVGAQHLLRKAALEKMSSPERLDMAMRVTSPASWIALIAFGSVIVTAVLWGVFGKMTERVDGSGILIRGGAINTVEAKASGTLTEVLVEAGDTIEKDQIVARLTVPDTESEIRATKDRIADLSAQDRSREADLRRLNASYSTQIREAQARRENIAGLVEKGYKTRNDLAAIDAEIARIRQQQLQAGLSETGRENQLADQRRLLDQLEEQLANNSVIRAPYAGRVAAVLKPQGQVIQAGERLLNLEDPDAPFSVMLFVPFAEGKKVQQGMTVNIAPSTVKPEEHGFIVGEIRGVSSQAVTPEEVRSTLNNDALAQKFGEDTPFRVDAIPLLDPATASGFKWTSAGGPPSEIGSNTPVSAQIVVDYRRPISYVIPMMKKTVGIGS